VGCSYLEILDDSPRVAAEHENTKKLQCIRINIRRTLLIFLCMMLSHIFEADFLTLYNYINCTLRSRLTSNHHTWHVCVIRSLFII
jgi:hypothetical protein